MCGKFTTLVSWSELVAFSQPLTDSGGIDGQGGGEGCPCRILHPADAGGPADKCFFRRLNLCAMAEGMLADARSGRNGRHALVGLLRQSAFGRLAGYEDVNDAERLRHDPAMR